MVAVIMAAAIAAAVMVTATISAVGIMAAAIFTAGRRLSGHSPDTVRFRPIVRISRAAAGR
jgi:hypothetical protein